METVDYQRLDRMTNDELLFAWESHRGLRNEQINYEWLEAMYSEMTVRALAH